MAEEKKPVLAPRITGNVVDLRPKLAERVKPKEKVVSTTRETERKVPEAPVEKTGVSKIGKSIETKAIEEKLTKGFAKTAEYGKINIKEQAKRIVDLVNNDLEKARRIIRGEEELTGSPRDGVALVTAMEEFAKKNKRADIFEELANSPLVSETSGAAQILRVARERIPDSATARLNELKEFRKMKAEKGKRITDAEMKRTVKAEVKKANLTKEELSWNNFLEKIKC